MPSYLYGLLLNEHAGSVPRDAPGLSRSAVRALRCEPLTALVSTVERSPVAATLDAIRAHDDVLQHVVNAGVTVAAARFNQAFEDDAALCAHVRERAERVLQLLRTYDGCVEMRLLVRDTDDLEQGGGAPVSNAADSPGRAYLERLRAQHAPQLSLADALGPAVRAERVALLPGDRGAVFAHLVEQTHVGSYREAVASYPALRNATIVGPLALYTFAESD